MLAVHACLCSSRSSSQPASLVTKLEVPAHKDDREAGGDFDPDGQVALVVPGADGQGCSKRVGQGEGDRGRDKGGEHENERGQVRIVASRLPTHHQC